MEQDTSVTPEALGQPGTGQAGGEARGAVRMSLWDIHSKVLKDAGLLDSFAGTVADVFNTHKVYDVKHLAQCYCEIYYPDSYDRIFPSIFAGYQCTETNRILFQAFSGLCLQRLKNDEYTRYVVIKFKAQPNFMLGLLELTRNFKSHSNSLFLTDRGIKWIEMYKSKNYVPYAFEKHLRKLLGEIPPNAVEPKRAKRSSKPRQKPAKKQAGEEEYVAEGSQESESGTDSGGEKPARDPKRRRGTGKSPRGHGSRKDATHATAQAPPAKGAGAAQVVVRDSTGAAGQPADAAPVAQDSTGASLADAPAVQASTGGAGQPEEEEEDYSITFLDCFSYEVIARSVKNPKALADACLEYDKTLKQQKKDAKEAEAREGLMGEISSTLKQFRKEAMAKMALQSAVVRKAPTRMLQVSHDRGNRYPINNTFTLFLNKMFPSQAVDEGPLEGVQSLRKTSRHQHPKPPPAQRDSRGKDGGVKDPPKNPVFIHMDLERTPAREDDLLLVRINTLMTQSLWDEHFTDMVAEDLGVPDLEQEGVAINFWMMIHPDAWDKLDRDMKERLFLMKGDTGFRNRHFYLVDNVEYADLDSDNLEALCTEKLVDIYKRCDRLARASLRYQGRSIHDIIEEGTLACVQDEIRVENETLAARQAKFRKKQERYEERRLANPRDPTNRPPQEECLGDLQATPKTPPRRLRVILVPLVFAVACANTLKLGHSRFCACDSEQYPNPVTSPVFKRYVDKPCKKLADMCGLTIPNNLVHLSCCLPLCEFFRARF